MARAVNEKTPETFRNQGFRYFGAQRRNRTADTGISAVNPLKSRGSAPLGCSKCTHSVYSKQLVAVEALKVEHSSSRVTTAYAKAVAKCESDAIDYDG